MKITEDMIGYMRTFLQHSSNETRVESRGKTSEIRGISDGELREQILQWDAGFYEDLVHQKAPEKIFGHGCEIFVWQYVVVGLDMEKLYESPRFEKLIRSRRNHDDEGIRHMIFQKKFHDAAKKKQAFYYEDETLERMAICHNIFLDGQYFARLVMYLNPEETRIGKGGEELFERFALHVQEVFTFGKFPIPCRTNDQLHNLCRTLIFANKPEQVKAEAVLKKAGWKRNHCYCAMKLRFFEEKGWESQLELTLPFLARELERGWKDSCAVYDGREIYWVINRSMTGEDIRQHDFHQRVKAFVREHVCNAGVSVEFHDFLDLKDAFRTADAALTVGKEEDPQFWYYLFDDYRLEYLMEKMQQDVSLMMLMHPAVAELQQYDGAHQTELAETLREYLYSNMNMTEAARHLYVHRTTFCRRMDHILQLTGIDLAKPQTVLELLLSFHLLERNR